MSSGVLTDRLGAKRAFGVGMMLFAVSSAACAIAPNLSLLIAARFVRVGGSWFGAARRNGEGRIRVAGTEHDVVFAPADDIDRGTVDTAYLDKYGRSRYVDGMTADAAAASTTRLLPR